MALQPRQQGVSQQVVHGPGLTLVRHAPRGAGLDVLFTGGDDYIARVLSTHADQDDVNVALEEATAQISSLDVGLATLVTGAEDGCVRVYGLPEPAADGAMVAPNAWAMQKLLTRTPLPVRAAVLEIAPQQRLSPDNPDAARRVAVVSDDLVVRVISLADPLDSILLTGHERAVRTASWCPIAPILITASCDGTARIWDLSADALAAAGPGGPTAVQVIKDVLPVTAVGYSNHAIYALWHPSGRFFVLPSKTNELVVYGRNVGTGLWERNRVFNGRPQNDVPPPAGPISALAFSFNGRYLASATAGNGQLTLWDMASLAPIARKTSESDIVSISWAVDRDALAWTDLGGQLYRWENVLPSSMNKPGHEPISNTAPALLVSRSGAGAGSMEESASAVGPGRTAPTARDASPGDSEPGADVDPFDVGYAHDTPRAYESRSRRRPSLGDESDSDDDSEASVLPSRLARLLGSGQKPFQATSTRLRNGRRFLAFNAVGTLVAVEQTNIEGERAGQTISFESFNTSARRNWRLTDTGGFAIGALSDQGAVFASRPIDPDDAGAVFFKPFELGWSSSSEWRVTLPQGVRATCLALGGPKRRPQSDEDELDPADTTAAVILAATSDGFIRIFSRAGLQRAIWSVGGRVVAVAAGSCTGMIVTAPPVTLGGYQELTYQLFDLQTFAPTGRGVIPLAHGTVLRWLGFNDLDAPAVWDSRGVLSVLASSRSGHWVPVLDVRTMDDAERADMHYWPIDITWRAVVTLVLKGARATQPDPSAPRPLIHELPLRVPVLTPAGAEEAKHEETFLRLQLASMQAHAQPAQAPKIKDADPDVLESEMDRALLFTLQAACKASDQNKALDAARELNKIGSVSAASKIAGYFGMANLAEQIDELKAVVSARNDARAHLQQEGMGTIVIAPTIQRTVAADQGKQSAVAQAKKALTQDFNPSSLSRRSRLTPLSGHTRDSMTPLPPAHSQMPAPLSSSSVPFTQSTQSDSVPTGIDEEMELMRQRMQDDEAAAEEAMREESDESRKRKAPDNTTMPAPASKSTLHIRCS